MKDIFGFVKIPRADVVKRDPQERVHDYKQYFHVRPPEELQLQGARCMDCGVPFCHEGCPLGNLIPDWNELVSNDRWEDAIKQLHATNNFPEFTGLICPAPCESACVLAINSDPVTIKQIELAIIERAWEEGWVTPEPPRRRSGRKVAVVGSGPSGLAVAAQLNKDGHDITVYERDEAPGGLLRFGVPDAKLEKWIIDRRLRVLEEEGVSFLCGVDAGVDPGAERLLTEYDAIVVAIGSRVPLDLSIPGRELLGVHLAMDYLYQRTRWIARSQGRFALPAPPLEQQITAAGKRVIIIGGGDTGMDCASNALREGAASVELLDIYPELPSDGRSPRFPWPLAPKRTATTYALEEGGRRYWNSEVIEVSGDESGRVRGVTARRVVGDSSQDLTVVPDSEHELPAELVLIAIGFAHPQQEGLVAELELALDGRGNLRAPVYESSRAGVFACGDARVGQSLVVNAIADGRKCARIVDRFLGGREESQAMITEEGAPSPQGEIDAAARIEGVYRPGERFFPSGEPGEG